MSNPLTQSDGVFSHCYPVEDLGFTPVSSSNDNIVLGDDATASGTVFGTGVPATVVILTKLSAGAATLNVCVGAAGFTPDYGSPTSSLALSGTAWQVLIQDTAFTYDDSSIETTTITLDQRFVGIELVAGSGGMTMANMVVLVVYEYTPGEDWFTGIRAAANGVANTTVGDGKGNLSFHNAFALNSYLNPNLKL